MNIGELRTIFKAFSPGQVSEWNDEISLRGRWVDVTPIDGIWDVYIRNMEEHLQGRLQSVVPPHKFAALVARLPADAVILDGEAYFQTKDVEFVKDWLFINRSVLGLRKRRPAPKVSIQERLNQ